MKGTFFGIGVGPGDPELLTIKAMRALEKADVLIAPKTEKKDGSVALSIAQPYLRKEIEIIYQTFPMVADFADSQESKKVLESNKADILALLEKGKNVAFLTLGDPMLYSTYIYIYHLLEHENITIKTVPGVPAFCAIACRFGYPLVEGNDILSIIPATALPEKVAKILPLTDNAVLLKVYKNFPKIVDLLSEHDLAKEAILVSRCGLSEEKCIKDIEAQKQSSVNYLSTILTRRKCREDKKDA